MMSGHCRITKFTTWPQGACFAPLWRRLVVMTSEFVLSLLGRTSQRTSHRPPCQVHSFRIFPTGRSCEAPRVKYSMYRDAVLHRDFAVVITSTNGTLSVCQIAYSLHTIGLLPCVVAYTISYLVRRYELRNREAVGDAIAGCALCTITAPCFG